MVGVALVACGSLVELWRALVVGVGVALEALFELGGELGRVSPALVVCVTRVLIHYMNYQECIWSFST